MAIPTSTLVSTDSPADVAAVLTHSNTVNETSPPRAIYVGGGGDITAVMMDDVQVLFTSVPQGTILPIRVKRIMVTGTTASLLVGMW